MFRRHVVVALVGILVASIQQVALANDVRVLSSRPDTVTGGDLLLEIDRPGQEWKAYLNGRQVTSHFRAVSQASTMRARLAGLSLGRHTLEVRVGRELTTRLIITNHPITGPVFSGFQQAPYICETELNGLAPPLDADCAAATRIAYYFKSTRGPAGIRSPRPFRRAPTELPHGFEVYDLTTPPAPQDVAQTTTSDGRSVPYIVRRELGTINRGVYDIQFLHVPGTPLPTPWSRTGSAWNGKLIYTFGGGGCGGYHQGTLRVVPDSEYEPLLAAGYALATSTLNETRNNCNERLSAETLSMVKEYFIETFGPPLYTIGTGRSGGSMLLHSAVQNYPRLLDGIIPTLSYPDLITFFQWMSDCVLLDNAIRRTGLEWSEAERTAVSGFATWRLCEEVLTRPWISTTRCDPAVPERLVYDRRRNPHGLRCTYYDYRVDALGRDPERGVVSRPFDNIGVQYGLRAYNSGQINANQFIELNAAMGGFNEDDEPVPARNAAAVPAVSAAYRHGLVVTGGGGLSDVPIIDWRPYSDDLGDIHDRSRSFIMRARLARTYGNADNQIILTSPRYSFRSLLMAGERDTIAAGLIPAVQQMDRWLGNIAGDRTGGRRSDIVVRNKPPNLVDSCTLLNGERIVGADAVSPEGRCASLYPIHGDPRAAAGAPLVNDVLKCQLKPVDPLDYERPLTDQQLARLRSIFPNGVCDYQREGVGQDIEPEPWIMVPTGGDSSGSFPSQRRSISQNRLYR